MKKFLLITFSVFIAFALILAATYFWLMQPVSADSSPVRFTIPKGQAISVIGQRLTEAKLIKHPLVFRLIVMQHGLANKLQAGSFELSPNMTPTEIAEKMTEGTDDVWVTILEGWRVEEVAEMLSEQELPAFDKDEFLQLAQSEEGYLFPDTYLLPKQATAQTIFDVLNTTFDRKVTQGLAKEIDASPRPLEEVIILASLLEREARGLEEMRHVAGVLENRLEIGMALQVDASLQYAKGYNATLKDWWATPTSADKQLDSPYNTYLHPGLPPKPISSPGIDAIRAALTPIASDDLFYIHDPKGNVYFAETLEQHNQNIDKYLR